MAATIFLVWLPAAAQAETSARDYSLAHLAPKIFDLELRPLERVAEGLLPHGWQRAFATPDGARWQGVLSEVDRAGRLSGAQLLDAINRRFNLLPYQSDSSLRGRSQHWASIDELLTAGGDCEDYVLAKYHAAVAHGFDPDDLRIVFLRTEWGNDHAVLLGRVRGHIFVLDNLYAGLRQASAELGSVQAIFTADAGRDLRMERMDVKLLDVLRSMGVYPGAGFAVDDGSARQQGQTR